MSGHFCRAVLKIGLGPVPPPSLRFTPEVRSPKLHRLEQCGIFENLCHDLASGLRIAPELAFDDRQPAGARYTQYVGVDGVAGAGEGEFLAERDHLLEAETIDDQQLGVPKEKIAQPVLGIAIHRRGAWRSA